VAMLIIAGKKRQRYPKKGEIDVYILIYADIPSLFCRG
jgi:hypothetical protein